MQTAVEKMKADIEAERIEVRQNAILTLVTFIGVAVGIYAELTDGEWLVSAAAFTLAYLTGGLPATIEAIATLRQKALDINLLMILAALAAAGVGEARDGAILLFLFSLAGTLEGYAMGNTKRAVAALMQLRPDEANLVLPNGTLQRTAVEQLTIGQSVIVKPGERMPIDGVITAGEGAVDQSSVTGESVPVDKVIGDTVFAGTVNQNAVLTITVSKLAHQSTIARMIELVTEAQEKRSPSEQFSDWFGQRYTIFVLVGSVVSLALFLAFGLSYDDAFYKAATLLVVASPCAIVISVPAAVLSALAAAARSGVLFKGGTALETFGTITAIALDKTGTLTEGKMRVAEVIPVNVADDVSLLTYAAALEEHSEHPLAKSVVRFAQEREILSATASDATAIPGKGITATITGGTYWAGNRALAAMMNCELSPFALSELERMEQSGTTTMLIGGSEGLLGIIGIADTVRTTAVNTLNDFKKRGVTTVVMLTGDTSLVAEAVGKTVGIESEHIHGAFLPEEKVKLIETMRNSNVVAFVGDGVNDAAALATAHVGVAMGVGGSDVALEAADVALLSDDLSRLNYAHALSKKANSIIKQNLFFAIGIMILMVFTTIFGNLPLPLGVIGHEGGTLLVVANGLRLLFYKPRDFGYE